MAEERDDVVGVEETGGGVRAEDIIDEDEDLVAHLEWNWIAREPRKMASKITSTSLRAFTILEEDPAPGDFRAYNVGPHQKICTTFHEDGFSMYEFVFKELGLRLPFSPLAIEILRFLRLAPSQLHSSFRFFNFSARRRNLVGEVGCP
jgi:hypothetical protein